MRLVRPRRLRRPTEATEARLAWVDPRCKGTQKEPSNITHSVGQDWSKNMHIILINVRTRHQEDPMDMKLMLNHVRPRGSLVLDPFPRAMTLWKPGLKKEIFWNTCEEPEEWYSWQFSKEFHRRLPAPSETPVPSSHPENRCRITEGRWMNGWLQLLAANSSGQGSKPRPPTECSLTFQVGQPVGLLVLFDPAAIWLR